MTTVANPGWHVTIDLKGTRYEALVAATVKHDADDWLQCFIRNLKFEGAGDPSKLESILETFGKWCDEWDRIHGIGTAGPDPI